MNVAAIVKDIYETFQKQSIANMHLYANFNGLFMFKINWWRVINHEFLTIAMAKIMLSRYAVLLPQEITKSEHMEISQLKQHFPERMFVKDFVS